MDSIKQFFSNQLKSTLEAILWLLENYPQKNGETPPFDKLSEKLFPEFKAGYNFFGKWSRKRILFHLAFYEEMLVIPTMVLWSEEKELEIQNFPNEETEFSQDIDIDILKSKFGELRQKQIQIINGLSQNSWNISKNTIWGDKKLVWVVGKTIQHSYEHGNKMLRHAIFWEYQAKMLLDEVKRLSDNGRKFDLKAVEELKQLE